MAGEDLYDGGFARLVSREERRQLRFEGVDDILDAQVDLNALFTRVMPPPPMPFEDAARYSAERKWLELQTEFQDQPEVLHLHAMLIAISRRIDPPDAAVTLFHRLWDDHGAQLVQMLTTRWRISAATTFADIGQTGDLRAGGMALSILFDMMKLHESERRISGQPGRTPFRPMKGRKRFPMPFDLEAYAFKAGDLDKVMLGRIWQLCDRAPTIRPLGHAMLQQVMQEPRSIFGRVRQLRKQAKEAGE